MKSHGISWDFLVFPHVKEHVEDEITWDRMGVLNIHPPISIPLDHDELSISPSASANAEP